MGKRILNIVIIFVAVVAITFFAWYFSALNSWQEKLFDAFFVKRAVSNEIVIFAIDNDSIASLGQWPWPRNVFADAINKLQTAKVIGIDVNFSEPSINNSASDALLATAIANSKPAIILPVQINEKTQEIIKPLAEFQPKSLLGLVNVINEDGTARKVKNTSQEFSSFGALAALEYQNNLTVPKEIRIDYAGPEKTFLTLPLHDLLENKVPETIYAGKIVFIGATAPDLHDFFQTPFGLLPGVEINANIANTILSQKFYHQTPWYISLLLILLCDILALALIMKIKKVFWLIISLAAVFAGINVLGVALFSFKIIIPLLYINLSFGLTAALFIIYQYISELKEKKFIYESFKYYLSPEIINEIIKDPKKLALGGQRKKITVFFSDIRGFSGMSEQMSPETLTHVVSEYMTEMTDIIMAQRGLVSQYFGDGIMAFWGAPLENTNQAKDACGAAITMAAALGGLNGRFKKEGIPVQISIGMGINTGEVIAGNIGSKKKFNYTVFGDGVNLTARLEGLNKEYGTTIIISESTKKELENDAKFIVRQLDTIMVKGKKEPTTIFELLTTPLPENILEHFESGRKYYQQGQWQEAIGEFSKAGEDGPSKLYLKRCQEFLQHPPAEWNGVYEFKSK